MTISIHAPLTGSDVAETQAGVFTGDFNPRSPYGERPVGDVLASSQAPISIHAPLTGSDPQNHLSYRQHPNFNPRSPYGERRYICSLSLLMLIISIHAPLTGSDNGDARRRGPSPDFNPRSPYGERRRHRDLLWLCGEFQSTLPLRGATVFLGPVFLVDVISIHAPLTGSDGGSSGPGRNCPYFNPRSPYGERQGVQEVGVQVVAFQSTLPLRGATFDELDVLTVPTDFNPRSPYGERRLAVGDKVVLFHFNPRSPYGERLCFRS